MSPLSLLPSLYTPSPLHSRTYEFFGVVTVVPGLQSPLRARWHLPRDLPVVRPSGCHLHRVHLSNAYLRVFELSSPSFPEILVGLRGSGSQGPPNQTLHLAPGWPQTCPSSGSGAWILGHKGPTSLSSAAHPPLALPPTVKEGPNPNDPPPETERYKQEAAFWGWVPNPSSQLFLTLS